MPTFRRAKSARRSGKKINSYHESRKPEIIYNHNMREESERIASHLRLEHHRRTFSFHCCCLLIQLEGRTKCLMSLGRKKTKMKKTFSRGPSSCWPTKTLAHKATKRGILFIKINFSLAFVVVVLRAGIIRMFSLSASSRLASRPQLSPSPKTNEKSSAFVCVQSQNAERETESFHGRKKNQ